MARILASFLTIHWAAAFGLLAGVCLMSGADGAFDLLGVPLPRGHHVGNPANALLPVAFAVAAMLFTWSFITASFGDGSEDDVMRMAFGSAGGVLSLVLFFSASQGATGLFPVVAAHIAALLASYLAIQAESRSAAMAKMAGEEDVRAAARLMALGAAHNSLLSRLSGRPDADLGGRF